MNDINDFMNWDEAINNLGLAANESEARGLDPSILLPHEFYQVPLPAEYDSFLAGIDSSDVGQWTSSHFHEDATEHTSFVNSVPHTSYITQNISSAFPQTSDTLPNPPSSSPGEFVDSTSPEELIPSDPSNSSLSGTPQQLPTPEWIGDLGNNHSIGRSKNKLPAKIGSRFSRESVQILKRWLVLHSHDPYPSEEQHALLQRQTGLNKTQISNWFSNARRRGKIRPQSSTLPLTPTEPIEVPKRPGTPAVRNDIHATDPLQRWVDSPPENEPASVTAIANAVASNRGTLSDSNTPDDFNFNAERSHRYLRDLSSASSAGTSSCSSLASAHSHLSDGSFRAFGSAKQYRGRRRHKNKILAPRRKKTLLITPLKPYQCTFCSDTFRTKHDWQRHEKSLHISLESWTCAPEGPLVPNPKTGQPCCAFCGRFDATESHIESHNFSVCKGRTLGDKTFFRKDHLSQHLKLVHNVMFLDWTMKSWQTTTTSVRSRCGFCGIVMASWSARVDHLAEHFKNGNTIADWEGDWGFEDHILDVLQNAIPPYLIELERTSTYPFTATRGPETSPRTAYELLILELSYFAENFLEDSGTLPGDERIQFEACRIIFASEALSLQGTSTGFSWLRDLLMASEEIAKKAQFAPLRQGLENSLSILKINGKDNLFDQCPLEVQLNEYVLDRTSSGLTVTDEELQDEACHIIRQLEEAAPKPSEIIADWLIRLIRSSNAWLTDFRKRVYLPVSQNFVRPISHRMDDNSLRWNSSDYRGVEQTPSQHFDVNTALGIEPSNGSLASDVREIISRSSSGQEETQEGILDPSTSMGHFHRESLANTMGEGLAHTVEVSSLGLSASNTYSHQQNEPDYHLLNQSGEALECGHLSESFQAFPGATTPYFFSIANCHRRLAQELARFVKSCMSPNNPNRHVPTDEEIQHQARWILFDSDDPWNQTAADNKEWLQRFKRDIEILPPGPGL